MYEPLTPQQLGVLSGAGAIISMSITASLSPAMFKSVQRVAKWMAISVLVFWPFAVWWDEGDPELLAGMVVMAAIAFIVRRLYVIVRRQGSRRLYLPPVRR